MHVLHMQVMSVIYIVTLNNITKVEKRYYISLYIEESVQTKKESCFVFVPIRLTERKLDIYIY